MTISIDSISIERYAYKEASCFARNSFLNVSAIYTMKKNIASPNFHRLFESCTRLEVQEKLPKPCD